MKHRAWMFPVLGVMAAALLITAVVGCEQKVPKTDTGVTAQVKHQAMTQSAITITLKYDTATGKLMVEGAKPVPPERIQKIYAENNCLQYKTFVLYGKCSPDCLYFEMGGIYYAICW